VILARATSDFGTGDGDAYGDYLLETISILGSQTAKRVDVLCLDISPLPETIWYAQQNRNMRLQRLRDR
jgi:hypothetical protein